MNDFVQEFNERMSNVMDKPSEIEQTHLNYHFSELEAVQNYNKIQIELPQNEIDKLVLEMHSSLENATIEQIAQRVVELNTAFVELQRQAKVVKQKHIVALEEHRIATEKLSPAEVKEVKAKKKVKDTMNEAEKLYKSLMGGKE